MGGVVSLVDGTLVQKYENQIQFENFMAQAHEQKVLTYIKKSVKDMWGNPLDEPPYGYTNGLYTSLYDSLCEVNIIESKITTSSIITFWATNTVSTTVSLEAANIKKLLDDKNSKKYNEVLQYFKINFDNLSALLKTYKNKIIDHVTIFKNNKPTGGRSRRKKRIKNKTNKHSAK